MDVVVKNESGVALPIVELHRQIPSDGQEYVIPYHIAVNYRGRLTLVHKVQQDHPQPKQEEKIIPTHVNQEIRDRLAQGEPVVTFVMCLKNRAKKAKESIETLVNPETAKYFNFIIVEDDSDNNLILGNYRYSHLITHYLINTNDLWNRSKTLNYGFKRSRTPLVAAWDADFRYPEDFLRTYIKMIQETDFNKTCLWISTTETDATDRRGGHFEQYSLYGGFYTYAKCHVEILGGYDETFINYGHEERDFNKRLLRYFNSKPYRRELRHVVYHKSHNDVARGFLAEAQENLYIMQHHDKENINVLDQEWGESELLRIIKASVADTLVVLGNGPSLRDFDFTSLDKWGYHTIGMNAAYRFWYRANWFPTYHACFDYIVTQSHAENFRRLIENEKSPIKQHFLLKPISNHPKLKVLKLHGRTGSLSDKFETFGYGGCTGVNCCQVGICLGYKRLVLLGIDANYKQIVDGAQETEDGRLQMVSTPAKNPNYFFDDYQQTGDRYNTPNQQIFHIPAWRSLARFTRARKIDVVNCSPISELDCFRKSPLKKEIKL
jgi:glycosyltransferase involved in cell wall biosynthesis